MTASRASWVRWLDVSPFLLVALVLGCFGWQSSRFLTTENLLAILVQSSPTIIVSVGMTFVLLVAGVDLSVGAIMFVGGAIAGKMAIQGVGLPWCLLTMLGVGLIIGMLNAWIITRLQLVAFIATLAMLYIGRGTGRWITQTRAMNLPDSFLHWGSVQWLGIPLPVWIAAGVVLLAQAVLSRTPYGRQLYAMGGNVEAARKAGLSCRRLQSSVYIISGLCAGLGGCLALAQLGSVSPKLGEFYEFDAITAAVLGGTSLFGGRGNVFPGTVLGAVLVKSIFSGLVMIQANPYYFPMITSGIIFLAVLLDSVRGRVLKHWQRRLIRPWDLQPAT